MFTNNLITFCKRNPKHKAKFVDFLKLEKLNENQSKEVLEILCEILMDPTSTESIAECFPQLLPPLVSMAIPSRKTHSSSLCDAAHRLNSVILGKLVNMNPDLLVYVLQYFDVNPAPFEQIEKASTSSVKKQRLMNLSLSQVSEYDITIACHRILQANISHFKRTWHWSKFYKYLKHHDDKVKWVALKCIRIILNMSEQLQLTFAQSLIADINKFLIVHENICRDIVNGGTENYNSLSFINNVSSIVSIGGIFLPVFGEHITEENYELVSVPSTEKNLRSLAMGITSRRCICLQGTVGCGKTALVEYLAKITGRDSSNFIKVQLGDQTDSKMLLGMYRCTDIPGEFIWQPGVLTEAVITGKWLLLEDIDSASLDMASVLSGLMETGTLSVPGYCDTIYAKTGFQLFVTQRLLPSAIGLQKQVSGASGLLQKHWLRINIEPLSKAELVTVVQTLFPLLSTIAARIIDVYLLFSAGNHAEYNARDVSTLKTGRQISTRDLIKWCSRAVLDFDVSSLDSALKIFQDAIDIFCYSVSDQEQRLNLAVEIAHKLGIVRTKAEYFCNLHKPTVVLLDDVLIAGRSKLLRKCLPYASLDQFVANFSFTRPSACLLERITSCVMQKEPVLLVGETGTGKTSTIQYLAESTGHKLIVINMNQQSESADLLGGYKPVDLQFLISPIREEFEILFRSYFAVQPNKRFLEHITLCYKDCKWKMLLNLMNHSTLAAIKRLHAKSKEWEQNSEPNITNKRGLHSENKTEPEYDNLEMLQKWEKLAVKLKKLNLQVKSQYSLAFSFIEGSLIQALRKGDWVLLDEINLANAETLECLSGLLERSSGSLSLLERGDKRYIKRHEDFTIFACMNPATDVGKKDLPVGLRNRFTEFFVDELVEQSDLQLLVNLYIKELNISPQKQEAIVRFYLNVRKEATNRLFDGTGHKPHYSLRTLCRALRISAANPCGNILRSLYEAFSLSFLTQLNYSSYPVVQRMIVRAILDNKTIKAILGTPIPKPKCRMDEDFVCFEGYWVIKGPLQPMVSENYILTDSVRQNLKDLVRIVSIGKIPILLQGDTSVGKTSLITYLAKASGHVCVRINNHEHTDLQEYIGSYVADSTGKLVFKEGVLVEAMHKGHWIILDELNLAPSDVLEALNRVLDDNRELFIPETQQTIKAHDNFMLFATQNPPGVYGGRKVLSRAFRNRFVELHFDEIPPNELQIILHKRCKIPVSYCKQIIAVMTDLQIRRKTTAAFAGKRGFITLRDLFRWGERYRLAPEMSDTLYDWNQHLADEGYLVLAAKVRKLEEAEEIRSVIKNRLKKDVDPHTLFTLSERTSSVTRNILEEILNSNNVYFKHIVWTYHMRRMAVLVKKSCQFREPVLLVGETGGGKTTICQLIAAMNKQAVYSVNCHMHTESSDFLGNLRPVREHRNVEGQKLFEWVDGPLINAMRHGDLFLADEISLADDSVLERLNSLLEPERSLLLSEKGIEPSIDKDSNNTIFAHENFIFIGTMNPGGDYGKKELSPALRNRFTEIWCEGCTTVEDLHAIIEHNICAHLNLSKQSIATAILNFLDWFSANEIGRKFVISVRDIITWVNFINTCSSFDTLSSLNVGDAYYHGAHLTYIDSVGSGCTGSESLSKLKEFKDLALSFLKLEVTNTLKSELCLESTHGSEIKNMEDQKFGIAPFYIMSGTSDIWKNEFFTFSTPMTNLNTLKLLRALQLNKPILLEGSPGVGKTSLVSALAKAAQHSLLRINLSDQTDIADLFGADLPVEGGKSGEFAWKDGPFLRSLRAGHWILLDELNLASQSVLEGLNACFDHRGEVYIPELGRTFSLKPGTRLFGCQNPLRQGGSRRGLPKSFLNRFTQVFIGGLESSDLELILNTQFPKLSQDLIHNMIEFNSKVAAEAGNDWGFIGSPWEMNLRDVTRWCEIIINLGQNHFGNNEVVYNPGIAVDLLYIARMRTKEDREQVCRIYEEIFSLDKYPLPTDQPPIHITEKYLYIGNEALNRSTSSIHNTNTLLLLRHQAVLLRMLIQCVNLNWMAILVGSAGCGKTSLVRLLANMVGQKLKTITVNSGMDTTEILGGFEQTDYNRHLEELLDRVEEMLMDSLKRKISRDNLEEIAEYHGLLENIRHLSGESDNESTKTMSSEVKFFLYKTEELLKLVTAMKTFEPCYQTELEEIEGKLRKLMTYVEEDKCLNAGGKFEWIDSVLVKCLQDGTWLLIDQVNLCSPAVLDRLNGLLEPNGVLTIGERGVDRNGNVVTVKPHKNFRLFLAMDPQYGEISRAMRNRGVEIYILGTKENINYNALDLKSLIHSTGVINEEHRNALLEIYRTLSEDSLIINKFTLTEMLQSAFLVTQQLRCGFSAKEAIEIACTDVYVKSKSSRDAATRQRLISKIQEIVNNYSMKNEEYVIDMDAITWSTKNLQDNARLTIIRQQGLLLQSAFTVCNKSLIKCGRQVTMTMPPTSRFLNEFLELQVNNQTILELDIPKLLPQLLLNFYELSSHYDAILRKEWLSKILIGKIYNEFDTKNVLLAETISVFKFHLPQENLAWDITQLPHERINSKSDIKIKDANRLALLLYVHIMIINDDKLLCELDLDKAQRFMSVKEYSNAVYHGKLAARLKTQPLITDYVKLAAQLKKCINSILGDSNLILSTEKYVECRKGLKWCNRFNELGKINFVDKSEISGNMFIKLEEVSLLLRVHYKWFTKFIKRLFIICKNLPLEKQTIAEIEASSAMIHSLNNKLISIHDPFRKLSKKAKQYFTLPFPHCSEASLQIYTNLMKLSNAFKVRDNNYSSSLRMELKILLMQLNNTMIKRNEIVSLWTDKYSSTTNNNTVFDSISKIQQFCDKNYLNLHTHTEISMALHKIQDISEKQLPQMCSKIQMWPIYEYIFLLYAHYVQTTICHSIAMTTTFSVTKIPIEFTNVGTIPSNLLGLLNALCSHVTEKKGQLLLLSELFIWLVKFTQEFYSAKDSKMLLHFSGITERDLESSISIHEATENAVTNNGPVLLQLIIELIMQQVKGNKEKLILAATPLGTYSLKINQLQHLNTILWQNSIALNSKQYNISVNDLEAVKFYVQLYVSVFQQIDLEYDVHELINTLINIQSKYKKTELETQFEYNYLQPVENLKKLSEDLLTLDPTEDTALMRGRAWLLLGYLQIWLFGNLGYIDPVHKVGLKLKYMEEDVEDFKTAIYVDILQSYILGISLDTNDQQTSTRHLKIKEHLQNLLIEKDNLAHIKAYRPSSSDFIVLAQEISNFRSTIGSYEQVKKHMNNINNVINEINSPTSIIVKTVDNILQEAEMWRLSVHRFSERIEMKFMAIYPDIVVPILEGLARMKHGVYLLLNEGRRQLSSILKGCKYSIIQSVIYNLVRYPTIGPQQENILSLVNLCTSTETSMLISKLLATEDTFVTLQQQFLMIKCGLYELLNYIILNKGLTQSLWHTLNKLLQQIVLLWKKQQAESDKRTVEESSMYKNKAENHSNELTEDEEIGLELQKLFPTHREIDFNDIENTAQSFTHKDIVQETSDKSYSGLISEDDIISIQLIHSTVVTNFINSKWLHPHVITATPNYIDPLIQRYSIVSCLLEGAISSLNEQLTSKLYNSLNLLVTVSLKSEVNKSKSESLLNIQSERKIYDFYKDSNVEEAKQCTVLCGRIINKVQEFLQEWPEHPTLRSICVIIERIYSFPITSAISRFLTGLELLLVKMHQWEENAHSGVSLSEYTLILTQQIISWRQLELTCWKGCLNTAYENLKNRTSKWWFFLYALIESYVFRSTSTNEVETSRNSMDDEIITKQKLIESLEMFMTNSSLIEFESKLHIIFTFHCHVHYFDPSPAKYEVSAILWNVYKYYAQFIPDVKNKINCIRTPIEKKLKDYVKIARWNDISYWAVKETVEKTHRQLHKFIKDFENGLKQSAVSCLVVKCEAYNSQTNTGIWDDKDHTEYVINPVDFTVCKSIKMIDIGDTYTQCNLILRSSGLLTKAKHLCKEVILLSSYPCIRIEMERFIQEYMEKSSHLRSLEVDKSLPKKKQVSQAKSILQQKKMALANYFKTLNRMGVSYRIGTLTYKNDPSKILDFTVPPVDLSVASKFFTLSKTDEQMLIQWAGCDKYYYKSLIKLNGLNAMVKVAQTDLGPQNIERCIGYCAHIMLMAHRQKKTIVQLLNSFINLRMHISNLQHIENNMNMPKQDDMLYCIQALKDLLVILETGFEQLDIYLKTCPVQSVNTEPNLFILNTVELPILTASQGDVIWKSAKALIVECLTTIKIISEQLASTITPINMHLPEEKDQAVFLTSKHFDVLVDSYKVIENLLVPINKLGKYFSTATVRHPIMETIQFLETNIYANIRKFKQLTEMNNDIQEKVQTNSIQHCEQSIGHLLNSILLVIQKMYKENINLNNEPSTFDEKLGQAKIDNINVSEEFEASMLTEKLILSLERNVHDLMVENISQEFNDILLTIMNLSPRSVFYCSRLLLKCLPLLDQYVLFVQFYLTEQVASFRITCKLLYLQLNVFLDLASNGFCIPKDLDIEESDRETESQDYENKGGMGLGEGEGQTDVSERIESEDQLEDANRPDEDKNENDRDCKEEEGGIDMSENFDSKLQDLERDDDDKESHNNEDDNLDKEMGETEEGADELDKEIWGDDREDSENGDNQSDNGNEEQGQGEPIGDTELSAKLNPDERNCDDKNNDNANENQEQKKDIDEMNEPEINDDQIDPYHGLQEPGPEPEPLDLPEDINLDGDDDVKENNEDDQQNPFDIDEMKESKTPPEKDSTDIPDEHNKTNTLDNSSEDENEDDTITEQEDEAREEDNSQEDAKDNNACSDIPETIDQNITEVLPEQQEEKTIPSADNASKEIDNAEQTDNCNNGSRDLVAKELQSQQENEAQVENNQRDGDDKGTGQAHSDQQETGHSTSSTVKNTAKPQQEKTTNKSEKRKKPGKSDINKSLMEKIEPEQKKLKMIQSQNELSEEHNEDDVTNPENSKTDMCQHITNSEKFDDYTMDAATEDQVKEQVSNVSNEEETSEKDQSMDIELHEDDAHLEEEISVVEQKAESLSESKKEHKENKADLKHKGDKVDDGEEMETTVTTDGKIIETARQDNASETSFYTKLSQIEFNELPSMEIERKRFEIEKMLSEWHHTPSNEEAIAAWQCLNKITESAARDLSEKLRLVLEPTQASRLKGDYRTGKRINMRKIIPYIASQFRKDKIWLRRTKPSKRDYQIVLALDDSSSMADNHSKELAFESLSLISKAMMYLEIGQLCVISFGECVNMLHPLGEPLTEQSGARLVQEMKFEQKKTMIGQLVDFTVDMFESHNTSADNAKLLVVLSDGRGIFSEGTDKVNAAVRRARLADIFLVFIIVDNPINKDSILDIRMPVFEGGKLLGIQSYMDHFPFPFYMILRDINALPGVLSDALRQWFEVVGKIDT